MPASDQLTRLAARAKEAEDRAATAQGKAKADLEQDVATARASVRPRLRSCASPRNASKGKLSVWWNDVQRSWNEHVAKVREDIDAKRAEHDVDRAQRNAEIAEDAPRLRLSTRMQRSRKPSTGAVLDAALARQHADELSPQSGATA